MNGLLVKAGLHHSVKPITFKRLGNTERLHPLIEVEHKQLQAELAEYELRDIFNVDETGMLAFATPDQGLATRKMSGRKQDKF